MNMGWIWVAGGLLAALGGGAGKGPTDARVVELPGGYVRVETARYSIEIPKGWKVSEETRWGQRKAVASDGAGVLGVMTAAPSSRSWEELYRTSLFFILRERGGTPTPYEVRETEQGYEAASFSVLDDDGFARRRYVLLRSPEGGLLALSVEIGQRAAEGELRRIFDRMVRSARLKESGR